MLWHICRCGAVIPQNTRLCGACEAGQRSGQSRHMEYNRFRRDGKKAAFYVSSEWRAARAAALRLYDGIDIYAYYVQHRVMAADMVHHVVEIEEDWGRRLDIANLLPLDSSSHGIISAQYRKGGAAKSAMQEQLRGIIDRHWKDRGGIEKVSAGFF